MQALTVQLFHFLALLIGRKQTLNAMTVRLADVEDANRPFLQTYWSYALQPEKRHDRSVWTRDCLLWPLEEPDEFKEVTKNWFTTNEEHWRPRANVIEGLSSNQYGSDRIVRAANMFDHLLMPSSAPNPPVSDELKNAIGQARELFRSVPDNNEKSRALNAISNLEKARAKDRVAVRARKVMDRSSGRFSKLDFVTDQAVLCRNYFVHGNKRAFDYESHPSETFFLTQTLEFVFVASELIDCGWNIERWIASSTSQSHPLGTYKIGYQRGVELLEMAIEKASKQ